MSIRDRIANLTPDQRALLAERLARQQADIVGKRLALPAAVPDPAGRYEPFELTDLQHAYLIGRSRSFALGNLASKVYLELACDEFDLERFNRAWQRLVERHDVLRLVITDDHRQRVLASAPPWAITVIDATAATQEHAATVFADIKRRILSDLRAVTEWPLFDLVVTRLDGGRSHVHFGLDLLNFDAGSIAVLMDELSQLYANPRAELPAITLTFRDYLHCEKAIRETDHYRRSEAYWLARADTIPPGPDLPLMKQPSEVVDTDLRFTRRVRRLAADRWVRIKAQAARTGLTPTAVMLTVYAEALGLWSSSTRFSVNVPFFNRLPVHPQVAEIIGDFTTVELLEIDRSAGGSFRTRAQRLHTQLLSDLEHRFMDGVKLLRVLAQKRGGAFQHGVPFVLTSLFDHSYTESVATIGSICESSVNQTSQVWVDVAVDEYRGELIVRFETVDQLFPAGVVEGMLDAMVRLLTVLSDDDENWESPELDFFPPDQAARRAHINATEAPFPDTLLHTQIASIARQQPDAPALVSARRTMTYGELLRLSTQVGRLLRDAGAQVDRPVAVVMDKGWEQVVGAHGVLHAGAPYLPIDPAYPGERIRHLLEKSGARHVLTQSWIDAVVDWPSDVERVCVDVVDLSAVDESPLPVVQDAGSLAYVLYTSGSTGEPKGVMIEHRGVVNRMLDVNSRYGITRDDRIIALTALQHDLSVYDLFGTFFAGATLIVPDAEGTRDPGHWLRLMRDHRISVWNSVPAFMEMFVHHVEEAARRREDIPQSLRRVVLAGDFIPVSLPDRIRALFRRAEVISSGGPTETTIWDIWYPVGDVESTWRSIPYGKPMANARYYLLKDNLEVCPDWVAGEMYIGGVGLARGYWGDQQRTAERFIRHPRTGERLYRSGDMGRMLPDGNIEISGRADFQVKVRGFRVELGEIETVLNRHEEVRDAVVVAVGDSAATKRLVAYVVPRDWPTPSSEGAAQQTKPGLEQVANHLDPVSRLEFKTKRLGIRTDTSDRPRVALELPESPASLRAVYLQRQSYRRYLQTPVEQHRLANLLACLYHLAVDELPFPKSRYPSAGSLYPVQPYLFVKQGRVEGLDEGCYYYDPTQHALSLLSTDAPLSRTDVPPANYEIFDSCAFVILLFGKLGAIEPLYGSLSQQFCMLEAGYMSQLLMEEATRHDVGLCPSGSILSPGLSSMFCLDADHVFLHALMGGRVDAWQRSTFQATEGEPATATSSRVETVEARLQKHLQAHLPEYMVPSRFVIIDAMPLSPNGKVNRRALPAPDAADESDSRPAAPAGELERRLVEIWRDVLRAEHIGVHDNFFDLGGNSIHVIQVHNRIRTAFDRDIPIVEIFGRPTVASLAALLSGGGSDDSGTSGGDRGELRKALRRRRRGA